MEIGMIIGAIIGIAIGSFVNGILIFIVGKLKLGMEVSGFGSALLAGFLVALVAAVVAVLWAAVGGGPATGLIGAIINLIVAAAILLAVGNALKGVTVKGWGGALVAAIAIGVLSWLLSLALTPMVTS